MNKLIIGKNYPNVGDTIYWEDLDGVIHDDVVLDIDKDPEGKVVTNYFTYISDNGGGVFIDEESVLDPELDKVKEYRNNKAKDKVREISKYFLQKEIRNIYHKRLSKWYNEDEAMDILNILSLDYE